MTKITNSKQKSGMGGFMFRSFEFRIWDLFDPILRLGGACDLEFFPKMHQNYS
jgi:hypothetical protein